MLCSVCFIQGMQNLGTCRFRQQRTQLLDCCRYENQLPGVGLNSGNLFNSLPNAFKCSSQTVSSLQACLYVVPQCHLNHNKRKITQRTPESPWLPRCFSLKIKIFRICRVKKDDNQLLCLTFTESIVLFQFLRLTYFFNSIDSIVIFQIVVMGNSIIPDRQLFQRHYLFLWTLLHLKKPSSHPQVKTCFSLK